jgi:plastocyanin domain-containing protein
MENTINAKITALKNKPIPELQKEFEALFDGQKASSDNKVYLIRRIAYRLQELEYGGLSQKAQNRLKELVALYDPVNNKAIRPKVSVETQTRTKTRGRDTRLPIPGTIITKDYRGKKHQVKVLEKGFEYEGKIYKHLTAIADKITGAHWNGYNFFNL